MYTIVRAKREERGFYYYRLITTDCSRCTAVQDKQVGKDASRQYRAGRKPTEHSHK
jgi:hypothetical protein